MPEYGDAAYWDERYAKNDTNFDWFITYNTLRDIIVHLLKPEFRILHVGCGNSSTLVI